MEENDEKNEFFIFFCLSFFRFLEERCSTNLELAAGLSEKADVVFYVYVLDMCFWHMLSYVWICKNIANKSRFPAMEKNENCYINI